MVQTADTQVWNHPPEDGGFSPDLIDTVIARWAGASGPERAGYQPFLRRLGSLSRPR